MTGSIAPRPPSPPGSRELTEPTVITMIARGVALVVVVPLRLLWELLAGAGRLVDRYLLTPVGRFTRRWILRPLGWLFRHAVWLPLTWVLCHLVWRPLAWVGHHLIWLPVRWLARALAPVWRMLGGWLGTLGRLFGRSVAAVGRVLVAAVVFAWRAAGRFYGLLHRFLLRPVGIALAWLWCHTAVPVGRALGALWRVTVAPATRWLRRAVFDPMRLASREMLVALGLRR